MEKGDETSTPEEEIEKERNVKHNVTSVEGVVMNFLREITENHL
jgi:hypothetical protein